MNGLRYIRTRCNLSLSALADMIGVTRQALSAWENGRKDIPEQRREQLAAFFGVEKEYFGEISEEEKKCLLEKAMFRYDENGKETYRYKPQDKQINPEELRIYFIGDRDISLDEEYVLAQQQKKEILEKIDDIIKWTDHAGSIQSQIMCINRGCEVYNMINQMMEKKRGMKSYLKVPFFYELTNIWKAMLVAYDLLDKKEIRDMKKERVGSGEDGEWILELSDQIKARWEKEVDYQERRQEEIRREIRMQRERKTLPLQ